MKLLATILIILHLSSSFAFVPADIDADLRKSIETVMTCRYRDPPKGPVIAVTPSRFTQIVVILHERFKTPACVRSSKSSVDVTDERTWPFCVFGRCVQGKCECASHFSGPKCSTYTKKCWLMYCYLTSCHPSHQSLHCICDPSLYGTKITSGIYWYNEGKSSKYVPPPPGWKDDVTSVIQWKDDSVGFLQKQHVPNAMTAKSGDKRVNTLNYEGVKDHELFSSQIDQKKRPSYSKAVERIPGFHSAGRIPQSKAKYRENSGGDTITKDKESEKSDVEEALEELEKVSSAFVLISSNIYILILIFLSINFQFELVAS